MESLFNYYETKDIRPTYAAFGNDEQLNRYSEQRKNFFYRLNLPYTFFKGKKILEFGPDTGENALVFAKWGATLTLVEPNIEAHSYIRNYLSQYGLESSINGLVAASLLEFKNESKFDVIDAEGFIYTIQPNIAWIKKAKECLEEDGLFVISFIDLYGGFIELLQKAIYNSVKRNGQGGEGLELAQTLFLNKWNSIIHTRKIESWFMDVIENPFVRLKYLIDPADLLRDAHSEGFRLFSSWPTYRNAHSMDWIKKPFTAESELNSSVSFIQQSRLSHFLGNKCFIPVSSEELSTKLKRIVEITDGLIDADSEEGCKEALGLIADINKFLQAHIPMTDDLAYVQNLFKMIKDIFEMISSKKTGDLTAYCQTEEVFISTWGMGTHNVIFQKA